MKFEKFEELSKEYNLIPVYEKITADMLTPVLAYLKIRNQSPSFLLESVEGSLQLARYSFIGREPEILISNKRENVFILENSERSSLKINLFELIRDKLATYRQPINNLLDDELPDFTGGIVGYIGYENISLLEPSVNLAVENFYDHDSQLGLYKTILAFDHFKHQIILISNVYLDEYESIEAAFQAGVSKIQILKNDLKKNIPSAPFFKNVSKANNSFDEQLFEKQVDEIKENILSGEIFQLVLSKRFNASFEGDLINVYRALRIINPSPYMYFLEFDHHFKIIGTSPEDLVKVKNGTAQLLPIAGTRRRGKSKEEDALLERNLIEDEKEIAEHTMLLDLGRNDLGRVCEFNSVKVSEQMKIQKYSHVMHLVSKVEGQLQKNKNSIDALKACFPAGTVTGAPKIRAMQLINKWEDGERNVYAGAVGYLDFSGNLDMCIAIRTLFSKGNKIFWQAGAGIVVDSKAELEAKEIRNKANVIIEALIFAEELNEHSGN